MVTVPQAPWSLSAEEVCGQLRTDAAAGLAALEAARRLAELGPNQLAPPPPKSRLRAFLAQFANLMVGLLAAAAVVSAVIGDWHDAGIILAIVVANAVIGYVQEQRAEDALQALKKLQEPVCRAWRDGMLSNIAARDLVPGDVISVVTGLRLPADCRLLAADDLEVDEAPLTGESLPVAKQFTPLPAATPLAERANMAYSGTAVVAGTGRGVVTATGMATELGRIAGLLETTKSEPTPLERRLAELSRRLAFAVVGICIVVFAAGMLRTHAGWTTMLLSAVSLAVAAIPEGLTAVITIALALGSTRMAARRAIVRQLAAVETLGSVDVICSDKTGTLTQNRMSVADLVPACESPEGVKQLLEAIILVSEVELDPAGRPLGSPTEVALVEAALIRGADLRGLRARWRREATFPFASSRKRMSTIGYTAEGPRQIFVKGAAEMVLARADRVLGPDGPRPLDAAARAAWESRFEELAGQGRRILALATRPLADGERPATPDDAERDLCLLGAAGLIDPPRPEARAAITACQAAGIRVVMITGDHPTTARAIAGDLGILRPGDRVLTGAELDGLDDAGLARAIDAAAVFARVSPEHKLRIVRAQQAARRVVAMTGDGVNDAPALRQADIGLAMGITGTDVSKEAANMILADDNFATIVAAVEEGRVVYDNIRRFVRYLLTANTSEVLTLFVAILLGMPLPLLPVHLLWINLVTDGLPALALGFELPERDVMRRAPRRRDESIFAGGVAWEIVWLGAWMAVCCLVQAMYLLLPTTPLPAPDTDRVAYMQTATFYTLAMFQLCYVLALRSSVQSFFTLGLWSNYRLTGAVLGGVALQLAAVYFPVARRLFDTVPLAWEHLLMGTALSTLGFWAVELGKLRRRRT